MNDSIIAVSLDKQILSLKKTSLQIQWLPKLQANLELWFPGLVAELGPSADDSDCDLE